MKFSFISFVVVFMFISCSKKAFVIDSINDDSFPDHLPQNALEVAGLIGTGEPWLIADGQSPVNGIDIKASQDSIFKLPKEVSVWVDNQLLISTQGECGVYVRNFHHENSFHDFDYIAVNAFNSTLYGGPDPYSECKSSIFYNGKNILNYTRAILKFHMSINKNILILQDPGQLPRCPIIKRHYWVIDLVNGSIYDYGEYIFGDKRDDFQ